MASALSQMPPGVSRLEGRRVPVRTGPTASASPGNRQPGRNWLCAACGFPASRRPCTACTACADGARPIRPYARARLAHRAATCRFTNINTTGTEFLGTLDYIWHSVDRLQPLGVLQLPRLAVPLPGKTVPRMPASNPSDHFPLCAQFGFVSKKPKIATPSPRKALSRGPAGLGSLAVLPLRGERPPLL